MIRIYRDKLMYSPFEFMEYQEKFKIENIKLVTNVISADIIMSSYISILKKYAESYGKKKKYILWTHEPYHDYTYSKCVILKNGVKIEIMNVYTGDVFTHNYRYFYFKDLINKKEQVEDNQVKVMEDNQVKVMEDKSKKNIVVLSTYYKKEYYKNNKYTLLPKRYELIEYGYKNGLLDVHGKDWNNHEYVRSIGNTRNVGDRRESKEEILQEYKFNICLENVEYPYYVTEKIWEPIKYGCLPIYYGNSTIYEIFEKKSFVDYHDFKDSKELYDYLMVMTKEEYVERYNRCVDAFNRVIGDGKNNVKRLKSDNMNINYLEYESCYKTLLIRIKNVMK